MKSLKKFYYYIVKVVVGYGVIVLLTFVSKQEIDLVDIVTACKIYSLFLLLLVNGDIAKEINRDQKDIKVINYLILFLVIVITLKSRHIHKPASRLSRC
jgi:hypothetical protein